MKGLLLIVSGPSGTGKGTICKELIKRADVELSISATTRSPRTGEIHGKDYFFMSEEAFLEKINNNGFLEYVEVFGSHYGTPESFVRSKLDAGRDIILEIDVQGATKVKEKFPECVLMFILPPTVSELERRIVSRGSEDKNSLALRLGEAKKEVSHMKDYDYCVINDKVDVAVDTIMAIIRAEHCKIRSDVSHIIEKFEEAQNALS